MTNIPTELLRTLVSVADLRSFTKAAQVLGVTQPAISSQIKRLQTLLGRDLFDKRAPGVTLSPAGEDVVSHARKLLEINDQILRLAGARKAAPQLCLGISNDFADGQLPWILARLRAHWPEVCFDIRREAGERLLDDLQAGECDVVLALSDARSDSTARCEWTEELTWVRGASTRIGLDGLVPLATCADGALHRLAVSTLEKAGRSYRVVFTAPSMIEVAAAVAAGFGVTVLAHSQATPMDLVACDMLPALPAVAYRVHVRDADDRTDLEQLADGLAEILRAASRAAHPSPVSATMDTTTGRHADKVTRSAPADADKFTQRQLDCG